MNDWRQSLAWNDGVVLDVWFALALTCVMLALPPQAYAAAARGGLNPGVLSGVGVLITLLARRYERGAGARDGVGAARPQRLDGY